ncbi:hypothetical protein BGZ76_011506 [Entomortierella beljakovae]|nr:hypothetical protein BGZ76_011506 [Entomortierella beljakovae]
MAFIAATSAQSNCIPLTTSTACPSFNTFFIDTGITKAVNEMGLGMNMSTFTDVAGFDKAVVESGGFMTTSSCTGYDPLKDRIRYQDTVLCTIAIQESASCNTKAVVSDMCQTSCTEYAKALNDTITKACPSDSNSRKQHATLASICSGSSQDWLGLQDKSAGCVNATTNEASTCGFGTQVAMCSFCTSNPTDTCCASTAAAACTPVATTPSASSPSTTSAAVIPTSTSIPEETGDSGLTSAALIGIIVAGVVVALLLFGIVICCIRRKKAPANKGNLSRHMSSSSASKYNISAPKMQEEGFANSLGAPAPIPMTALPSISTSEKTLSTSIAAATVTTNRDSRASTNAGAKQFCQALYPYQASMADELDLNAGDIVNVHRVFDDGWAVGVNMNTSNEGAFPVVCVMFVDEASLEDDFEDVNMHSMTPMGHREDDTKGGSVTPSRASSPVNLPKRHSSMIRDSAIIPGVNAPMTSSPLAGGNNNQKLQAPVRDTMMSDASSINRWWEGEK